MTIDPYIILGAAIVGFLVGMTGAGGGALMTPIARRRAAGRRGGDGAALPISFSASVAEQPNYATYTWDFGDGSPMVSGYAPGASSANSPNAAPCEAPWLAPCAASTFHAYQNAGVYDVTLT